jgi:magnesium and cobalt transporter
MLSGVLEVAETQVRDVMIPRSQMVVIDVNQPFDQILTTIVESGHSRFPVIGEDRDEVMGVLLAKDLLRYFGREDAVRDIVVCQAELLYNRWSRHRERLAVKIINQGRQKQQRADPPP